MIALLIVPMLAILEDPFFLIRPPMVRAHDIHASTCVRRVRPTPIVRQVYQKAVGNRAISGLPTDQHDIGLLDMATEDQIEDDYSFDDDEQTILLAIARQSLIVQPEDFLRRKSLIS